MNEDAYHIEDAMENCTEEATAQKTQREHDHPKKNQSQSSIVNAPRPISTISLKMISDCVNLVVDQSHIQLSSVIHISKRDNLLNIEHSMMESMPSHDSSSESTEEAIVNRNSYFQPQNIPECSQTEEHVVFRQPTVSETFCSNSLNTAAGPSNDNSSSVNSSTAKSTNPNLPPAYTKKPAAGSKSPKAVQNFQQMYAPSIYQLGGSSLHPMGRIQSPGTTRPLHKGMHGIPPLHGAPPTYSAIMRIGPNDNQPVVQSQPQLQHNSHVFNSLFRRPEVMRMQPSPPFIAPPRPPPTYAEVQGVNVTRAAIEIAEDIIWGPHPMSVHCPNCGNIVTTVIHMHRSNLTHFSALALCLCGCWPCCLLPYCIKTCKTTYHECPICFTVIGMYTPW